MRAPTEVSVASTPSSLSQFAMLACLWEATAPKPGNVYRGADFSDMTYADFVTSSVAIGPVFDAAGEAGVGGLVLAAVEKMREAVVVNTHLGTILLLAPLAKAASQGRGDLAARAGQLARETTVDDAALVYAAIRAAAPGGIGKVEQADVASQPSITLHEAMRLAVDRDLVAKQYTNGFADVHAIAEEIQASYQQDVSLSDAIVRVHVWQMARSPDSLIARKCGPEVARQSADRAAEVIDAGALGGEEYQQALADLDFWLRSDGHRRNPGTTADLLAAGLFLLLVEGRIDWPVRFY